MTQHTLAKYSIYPYLQNHEKDIPKSGNKNTLTLTVIVELWRMSPGHRNCDATVTAVWLVLTRQQCKGNRHAAKARDQQQRRLVSLKHGR
ncbi:hypothetical protein DPMN_115510 [Dreissena polymorpha]|uniref:Uncharacterized protein n=1 Tax=Dreissena polymorpha TaxID=45954 RepID=A0A9D4KMK4_DREPO|nr:hypothetical protein DPMN_115510 [Dreissena polymorpha]